MARNSVVIVAQGHGIVKIVNRLEKLFRTMWRVLLSSLVVKGYLRLLCSERQLNRFSSLLRHCDLPTDSEKLE